MRNKIFFLIFILFLIHNLFSADFFLNEFGHIIKNEEKVSIHKLIENNEFYLTLKDLKLQGNSFFKIKNAYLTLTTIEGNLPTIFRIYNLNGKLLFENNFKKVINISFSENGRYSIFSNGKSLITFDNRLFISKYYDNSINFSVDNFGHPAYIDEKSVSYLGKTYKMDVVPREIFFYQNKCYIFTNQTIYQVDTYLKKIRDLNNQYFDFKISGKKLYLVERKKIAETFEFNLFKTADLKHFELIERKIRKLKQNRMHEPIHGPLNYNEENFQYHIGNSYGEFQDYNGSPYLHPGVDFLGNDYQEVFAVHSGYVKAILTTGGSPYWRIAIANENVEEETIGYLYAHLNQNSFVYSVGDFVNAGDLLGTLYPWGFADFTHIHFARIKAAGNIWDGSWWTENNPLIDVVNLQDNSNPVFENAINNDLLAFRSPSGDYLDPLNLSGAFDIIAKCYDKVNSDWKIDVWDINYSLSPLDDPTDTLFYRFSFAFDMPLDTYIDGNWDSTALNIIYSQDETCCSVGDYGSREYYHIISHTDGDSTLTEFDEYEFFNSINFGDGQYWFKVTIRDASLNTATDSMMVIFNNGNVEIADSIIPANITIKSYPNPFKNYTKISYLPDDKQNQTTKFVIYNMKGQRIKRYNLEKGKKSFIWNGKDENNHIVKSGIYFIKISSGNRKTVKKIIKF